MKQQPEAILPNIGNCPFCDAGVESMMVNDSDNRERAKKNLFGNAHVECTNCGATGPTSFWKANVGDSFIDRLREQGKYDAVIAWNARGEISKLALNAARAVAEKIIAAAATL